MRILLTLCLLQALTGSLQADYFSPKAEASIIHLLRCKASYACHKDPHFYLLCVTDKLQPISKSATEKQIDDCRKCHQRAIEYGVCTPVCIPICRRIR